jgi:hypothetical protein
MAEGGFTELFLADIPEGEHDNAEYWMNLDGTEAALALKLRAIVETGSLRALIDRLLPVCSPITNQPRVSVSRVSRVSRVACRLSGGRQAWSEAGRLRPCRPS